jgi:hypothetical protein
MWRTAQWYIASVRCKKNSYAPNNGKSGANSFEKMLVFQIIAPILVDDHWSCYFWDFSTRTIHVLDSTLMRASVGKVQRHHYLIATRINDAISRCKDTFFQG